MSDKPAQRTYELLDEGRATLSSNLTGKQRLVEKRFVLPTRSVSERQICEVSSAYGTVPRTFGRKAIATGRSGQRGIVPLIAAVMLAVCLIGPQPYAWSQTEEGTANTGTTAAQGEPAEPSNQDRLISEIRQLTFAGKRAGEGYFSADGSQMVFQSEREPGNPFFQIYLMDRGTGDVLRVSPGVGKTTCAWIHPEGNSVLFASTQYDPEAKAKQQAEIEFRESGEERRYSWDYDETFDLVEFDLESGEYRRITTATGYDAEGSYSPDGELICFASNRRAYADDLSEKERELFELDPSSAMDIYIMRRDGSELKRLTEAVGYDGGPFFSPDGERICWRRFSENGATAEIMTMRIDGSDKQTLTDLGAMSWAPFYHPSGDYLIFATNIHGFANFELYMIDAAGKREPVRVTERDGFDGLPVFTPDGKSLVWTSNGGGPQSQLYEASWDDAAARELLELNSSTELQGNELAGGGRSGELEAAEAAESTAPGFAAADVGRHVDYLCRPELGGRLTGTQGELNATAYVAAYLQSLGLQPAGDDGTFFHEFEFVSNVTLGEGNRLAAGGESFELNEDWRPVFFSREGSVEAKDVVFAGYGIVAPAEQGQEEYDSYVHLDVQDKWVMVFRQMPQDITPERRQHLARFSGARYKAMVARELGAAGLIFVSGPRSPLRNELIPLELDGTLGGSSLSVISVSNSLAEQWMKTAGKDLAELQLSLDSGDPQMGFPLEGVQAEVEIDIDPVTSKGRNVLAMLPAADQPMEQMVLIGAHIDHLGKGLGGGSLAKGDEVGGVHRGADDNASGIGAMLEVAQYLAQQVKAGRLQMNRDVLFAAWSGEELGLRGSQAFADDFGRLYPERAQANSLRLASNPHAANSDQAFLPMTRLEVAGSDKDNSQTENPHAGGETQTQKIAIEQSSAPGTDATHAHSGHTDNPHASGEEAHQPAEGNLYPAIAACLNMDMVGRLRSALVLQGIGSSDYWKRAIEQRNAVVGLSVTLQNDCHLPTDASTFYLRGVPILSAFTGSHAEYHTPRDVPELLNYEGAAEIAKLMALITRDLVLSEQPPTYQEQEAQPEMRANLTAYLGTIPDYAQTDLKGVKLGGVTKGAPADEAGLQGGDIIIGLAGRDIENIYDYTYAIEALKIGETIPIKIRRGDQELEFKITPASRQ